MTQAQVRYEPVTRPLRLAQIGAGYWGANLIRNFAQIEDVDRFTICDVDPARLDKFKAQFPRVETTTDTDGVMADSGIDGVILAVPAAMHHRLARQALLAGKHVFVEKPLATSMADAQDLVELASERGQILMVGHTFLFNAAVKRVKEYIDSGELGQVYYVFAQRLNLGKVREDVNALWNLAPHDISIILYWLGETPRDVSARGFTFLQPGIEDVVFTTMNFPSGSAAQIHVSWLDPVKTRRMVVVGSKKMLIYDDVSMDAKITIYDKGIDKKNILRSLPDIETFGQFQYMHRIGDVLIPNVKFSEPLNIECRHFVECLREGRPPLTDGRGGLDVVGVLQRAQECLDAQRRAG